MMDMSGTTLFRGRNPFYAVVRRLLNQRLRLVESGVRPAFTDLRHLFYEARKIFVNETGIKTVPGSYANYEGAITKWCQKQAEDPELWWFVRDRLNIYAQGRAICDGEAGRFLVDHTTRRRVPNSCSFILVCEKETVSRELLSRLNEEGYKVNLISSAGNNKVDTKQALLSAVAGLERENFFVLSLHDYDPCFS